jgi:hypothetical protein
VSIDDYSGELAFLGNSWPCEVSYRGQTYGSAEEAIHAASQFNGKPHPSWEDIEDIVVYRVVRQKFEDPYLRSKLLATRDVIIEGSLGKILMKIRGELIDRGSGALFTRSVAMDVDLIEDMLRRAKIQYTRDVDDRGFWLTVESDDGYVDVGFDSSGRLRQLKNFGEFQEKSTSSE